LPLTAEISKWLRRFIPVVLLCPSVLHADRGNGVSAGLILSQDTSARAASLAGSIEALGNDISALAYNPASLPSLKSSHAIVAYQKGLVDDSFSQVQYGHPLPDAGLGASLSIYDGGDMDFIRGSTHKTVRSQRDVAATVGYAHNIPPGFVSKIEYASVGLSVKYLSSELVQTEKASTMALDLGAAAAINRRFRVAAAYQNIGASLKYGNDESDIPQIARAGLAYLLVSSRLPTTIVVDVPWLMNESRINPSAGVELAAGVVSIRVGYRTGVDLGGFTAGAGVSLNRFSMDYAFGLISEFDSTHRVSMSFRFGDNPPTYFSVTPSSALVDAPPAPPLPKPAVPVPVFQGVGREDCVDEKGDSSVVFYGKGRAKCVDLK